MLPSDTYEEEHLYYLHLCDYAQLLNLPAVPHRLQLSNRIALTILPAARIAGSQLCACELTAARSANPIQAQTQAHTSDYLLQLYA